MSALKQVDPAISPAPRPVTGRPTVVHVVGYYPPHVGGMERVAQDLAAATAEHDDECVVVLTSRIGFAGGAEAPHDHPGVTVRRLAGLELAHTPVLPGLLPRLLALPSSAVVHVHLPVAFAPEIVWLASKVRSWRYVAHYHLDADPSGPLGWLYLLYQRVVMRRVLRAADAVIAVSADQPATLVDTHQVAPSKIRLIPNGVGPMFTPQQQVREPGPGRAFRVLFVGRLAPQKNVPLLLRALRHTSAPVELTLVGDGEDRDALARLAERRGLADRIHFRGPLSGPELIAAYHDADVLVLPSWKESTGLVLLEAMACGLPVIGTRVQGIAETIGDAGLLVDCEEFSLAAAIDRIAADPALRADLVERGIARAAEASWQRSVEQLRALYAEIGGWPR